MMAQSSSAISLTEDCLPPELKMIPLPGHSWDMVGFRSGDGVVFLADCLSGKETLDKYQVSFLVDVQAYLDTLEAIQQIEAKVFIPAHAEPADNIAPLAQYNIRKVREISEAIEEICCRALTFETILQKIFDRFRLTMNYEQYVLVGSTVRSYLTWLKEQGRIQTVFENNMLMYQTNSTNRR